jgi:hypothetical protein
MAQDAGRSVSEWRSSLVNEVSAWADRRNASGAVVDWQFTTGNARIKLERLYPPHNEE